MVAFPQFGGAITISAESMQKWVPSHGGITDSLQGEDLLLIPSPGRDGLKPLELSKCAPVSFFLFFLSSPLGELFPQFNSLRISVLSGNGS